MCPNCGSDNIHYISNNKNECLNCGFKFRNYEATGIVGDRPFLIRKCKACNRWKIYWIIWPNDETFIIHNIYSTLDFSNILILINIDRRKMKTVISGLYGKMDMPDIFKLLVKDALSVR